MAGFNATDAIFFGFRVVQRDPTMVLALAGLTAVVSWAGMLWAWPDFVAFTVAMQGLSEADPSADPEAVFADMGAAYAAFFGSPRVLGYLLLQVLVGLAAQGAILRDLVRDRREGWVMGVQLGGDELRIFVVGLVVWILMIVAYFAGVFALVLVATILSFVHPVLSGLFALAAGIACLLGLILLGVLLSAAAPASVGERKFVVFGSWRIVRPRMWGLLGAYVVLFFLAIVAALIAFVLTSVLAPQATALTQGMTAVTDVEDAGAAFRSPGYLLVMIVNGALNVLLIALWSGVGAYAYRHLGGGVGYPNAVPPQDSATASA